MGWGGGGVESRSKREGKLGFKCSGKVEGGMHFGTKLMVSVSVSAFDVIGEGECVACADGGIELCMWMQSR